MVLNNFEGLRQVAVNGYAGDGAVQLLDFATDGLVGASTVPPAGVATLNFDVTTFLSQLISNRAAFAGFNFREQPANTNNFLVMSLDMAGAAPALSVDFSPPPASASTFQYAFTNNDNPRLWNFSGLYWMPFYNVLRWHQGAKGTITASYGIAAPTNIALAGTITGSGSRLKLRLRSTMEFADSSTDPSGAMRKDRLSLTFDPGANLLTGSDRVSETTQTYEMDCPNSFWECDHWKWVTRTSSSTQPVSIATPETTDGNWMLTLEIAQAGNKLSGTALITFANGETLPFQLAGSYAPKSQRSKILLKGTGNGKGANLMLSVVGPQMKIERLRGFLGGQSVKFP